nr:hypothetical protein [Tanacetum cinerariifolium]
GQQDSWSLLNEHSTTRRTSHFPTASAARSVCQFGLDGHFDRCSAVQPLESGSRRGSDSTRLQPQRSLRQGECVEGHGRCAEPATGRGRSSRYRTSAASAELGLLTNKVRDTIYVKGRIRHLVAVKN